MALIGYLDILSRVDTSGMKKGLAAGANQVKDFGSTLGGAAGMVANLGVGLGVGSILAGISSISSASAELITSTTHAAVKLGVTTKALTELRFAARFSGTDVESLDLALGKFSANLGNADEESGKTAVALRKLGLDAKTLATVSPDEALKRVAGAFQSLPDQATKSAVAMGLFGKGGLAILPFLNEGRSGIEKLSAEAKALGATFDDFSGKKVVGAMQEIQKVGEGLRGLANDLVIALSPEIKSYFSDMNTVIKEMRRLPQTLGLVKGPAVKQVPPKFDGNGGIVKNDMADREANAKRAALAELELTGSVADLEKELRKQIATFGMSAEQMKIFDLEQKGASKQALALARDLASSRAQLEANKKAQEAMDASAKHFMEGNKTPLSQYNDDLRELNKLLLHGKLTQDEYNASLAKSQAAYEQTGRAVFEGLATPDEKLTLKLMELNKQLKEGSLSTGLYERAVKGAKGEFKEAGKSLAAPSLKPVEAYVKRRKELLKGLEEGTITKKQFDRGIAEAHSEALEKSGGTEPKFASVAGGSAEARSLALKYTFGGEGKDPFGDLKKTGQTQTLLQGSMVSALKSIDSKLRKSDSLPEMDF